MDPTELHTKAVIAAALITSHAVAVPSLPLATKGGADGADGSRASGDGARLPPRSRRFSG